MATRDTDQTLAKVGPDEPIFVLRAQDSLAPWIVRHWARSAEESNVNPRKVDEAYRLADDMMRWQEEHGTKLPD